MGNAVKRNYLMKDVIEIFYDYMIIQREINNKREKETVS